MVLSYVLFVILLREVWMKWLIEGGGGGGVVMVLDRWL